MEVTGILVLGWQVREKLPHFESVSGRQSRDEFGEGPTPLDGTFRVAIEVGERGHPCGGKGRPRGFAVAIGVRNGG